jgi:hypothetical protein
VAAQAVVGQRWRVASGPCGAGDEAGDEERDEGDEDGARGGCVGAVGEEFVRSRAGGSSRGEQGGQDAEAERTAEVV